LGLQAQNECAEIKIRAERKGGWLLKEIELNKGGRPSENQSHDVTGFPSLDDIGIGRMQSSRWQLEASVPDDIFEEYVAEIVSKPDELTTAGVLSAAGYRSVRILNTGNVAGLATLLGWQYCQM